MEKQFDSYTEFIDNISRGGEIEFEYEGKGYFIGLLDNNTYIVTEKNNESSERYYTDAYDVGEYEIAGKKLEFVITKALVTFRCFE